ncbi:MAG: hypothetical protein ACXV3F_00360 [Frankiaceae bacterium]
MTTPLPIDISGIATPVPDPGHDAIRAAALSAVKQVWTNHLQLVAQLQAAQQQIADLQNRVAALEQPYPAAVVTAIAAGDMTIA